MQDDFTATATTVRDLAQLLRVLRRRQARRTGRPPVTYRQLAARTGWSHGIIGEYLAGRVLPPTDRFDELVRLLGATPAEQGSLATARDRVEDQRDPSGGRPPVVPRQLPADLTMFAGRGAQLARLDGFLPQRRPIVLSGTAGVGKTALAVHWAHRVAGLFPDGQLFVDLRGFGPTGRDPVAPGDALGVALGLLGVPPAQVPADPQARAGMYRGLLTHKQMLIVLDNASTAEQVRPLLPGPGASLALITSRIRLAGLVAGTITLDLLDPTDARTLLASRIGVERTTREPEAVDSILAACARLPLALSVVAARAALHPDFSLTAIADELTGAHSRLDALHSDDPKADVQTVFSWSYQRLSAPAQRLFRLGGLHPGPELDVPAAAALAGLPTAQVRPLLAELIRAQLVIEQRPGRFGMHDLLCAYALGLALQDEPAAERTAARHRLIEHYTAAATTAALILNPSRAPVGLSRPAAAALPAAAISSAVVQSRPVGDRHGTPITSSGATPARPAGDPHGPVALPTAPAGQYSLGEGSAGGEISGWSWPPIDEAAAAAWFGALRPTLLGAVRLAVECGLDREAWQLAWALADHLDRAGHWGEWIATQRAALGAAERSADRTALALAHRSLSGGYIRSGRHPEARRHLEVAFDLFVELADHAGAARCQHAIGWLLETQDRFAEAIVHDERALGLFRMADDPVGQARALNSAGWHHARLGHHDLALERCEEALELQRRLGDAAGVAGTLDSLGYIHHRLGEHAQAIASYRDALVLYAEQGDRFNEADTSIRLGDTCAAAGQWTAARQAWQRALPTLDCLAHPKAAEVRARLQHLDSPAVEALRWPVTT